MPSDVRLALLGAPGAGKGTQARRIAGTHGVPHVSTGDMFRAEAEAGSAIGREVEEYLESGRLVPDGLTIRLLEQRLRQPDVAGGFLLDGFPRTVPQAEALDGLLERLVQALDAVLLLDVPDEEIVERLTARRQCPVCGAIYNLRYAPPREGEWCDRVDLHGSVRLVQRPDDAEETVRRRLAVYHENTEPLAARYRAAGLLAVVDAAGGGPEEVFQRVQSALEQKGVSGAR